VSIARPGISPCVPMECARRNSRLLSDQGLVQHDMALLPRHPQPPTYWRPQLCRCQLGPASDVQLPSAPLTFILTPSTVPAPSVMNRSFLLLSANVLLVPAVLLTGMVRIWFPLGSIPTTPNPLLM